MSNELLRNLAPLRSVPRGYRRRGYRHAASWVFFGIFFAIARAQGPFVIRSLGGSASQSLLLNLAQGIPLLPAFLWVHFIERRNPVRLTSLVLAAGGAVMLLTALTPGLWSFSITLALSLGIITVFRPVLGTALEQIYPDEYRGQLMSLPSTVDMMVRVVCLLVVGWLLRHYLGAYRTVFPVAGACMIVGAWLFRGIGGSRGNPDAGPDPDSLAQHVRRSLRHATGNRTLLLFLCGYFFVTSGGVVYANALPLYAKDIIGLDPAQWGTAIAAALGSMLLSFWFWGRFMDRFGAPLTMILTWGAMGLMMGAMFLVRHWWVFLGVVTVRGLFMAGNVIAFFPIVMHFTESHETMRGMGLHSSFWGLRWLLMPGLVMLVVDAGLFEMRYLFLLSLGLVAGGLAIMTRVWWADRRRPAAG